MSDVFVNLIPRLAKGEILTEKEVGEIYNSDMCNGPQGPTYERDIDGKICPPAGIFKCLCEILK